MSKKYRLCKRGKIYYSFDSETGRRESLLTGDKVEAARILHAKNDASRQSGINITIVAWQPVDARTEANPARPVRGWQRYLERPLDRDALD
jgi:hypothetical protein